ncbi:aspartate/glutamate racemase family protein [Phosphitispora fastidiosa]|uniref:aspartate/glutamate racemase family protein n=1 Tax=Phosphitispora fastidiosa TaxID=2837202 RepID=UPI001E4FDA7E|nr:amino acid racemase [Phosphitispora fastidiosa]MBU7005226.1 aspartate racemase [Phosphitispora fastidiosa]
MQKLGIIGGMGPESTIDYYRLAIKKYREMTGGADYPELLINSISMTKMLQMVSDKEWDSLTGYLSGALKELANAGAEYAVIASNTPHIVFDEVQALSSIPVLSIVAETCQKAKALGLKRVGLLGTGFTMKADYYTRVFEKEGIAVIVPDAGEQEYINTKIFAELQSLVIKAETKKELLAIVKRMIDDSKIEGVVLGCTELPLILDRDEYGISFLNTSLIHVESAIRYGL